MFKANVYLQCPYKGGDKYFDRAFINVFQWTRPSSM